MPDEDRILDHEVLYRVVPDRKGNYVRENGSYRVSSAAFSDRTMQPSVDRAFLRGNNPENSKWDPTDFIASLAARDVRGISAVPKIVDVVPDPIEDHPQLPNNLAHALITAEPELLPNEKTTFRKLQKALARLSRWEIPPPDPA